MADTRPSQDVALGPRFVDAIKKRGGTLALSILSEGEFCGLTDLKQAVAAEEFVDAIQPQLYFMEFNAFSVLQREDELMTGKTGDAPDSDRSLLDTYCSHPLATSTRFSTAGFFSDAVRKHDELRSIVSGMAQNALLGIERLRERIVVESDLRRKTRNPFADVAKRPTATLALLRALINEQMKDLSQAPNENDAIDLLHAVVPGAYCEYVLLDKKWCHRMRVAKTQLRQAGVKAPLAICFSKANVERFLTTLENTDQQRPAPV